ncbi:hypothetical protein [Achromobacter sp.]|jgi:hypothetical protein|uniref:hypothetical protein n=1 Tax=Achromobacter sp. TaxID=134375 RepID=UPI00258F9DBD|nr:hypothetical protein [Achromobacter sp.]
MLLPPLLRPLHLLLTQTHLLLHLPRLLLMRLRLLHLLPTRSKFSSCAVKKPA